MPQTTVHRTARRRSPIPPKQRAYVASHPLGVCVAIGFALSGFVSLAFPELVMESAASIALPKVLYYVFSITWLVGGCASALGLIRGRRNLEAAGMALLATALVVDYIAIISIRATTALSGIFIVFLALGCALRSRHIVRSGYVDVALPIEKR